jgi:hypothetical protein
MRFTTRVKRGTIRGDDLPAKKIFCHRELSIP